MKFDLKNKIIIGIIYKDDGQIPNSKIKENKIINTNITFKKPYKLQVRASKVIAGKRSIKKATLTFKPSITLLDALKSASRKYEEMMDELECSIFARDPDNILTPNIRFEEAWKFVREKEDRVGKDNKLEKQFYTNWLEPLYKKPLNQIAPNDIRDIANHLKRAGRSARTQRRTYQVVNYIYSEINKSTTQFVLISPASMKGLPPLRNKSILDLPLEQSKMVAKALRDYPVSPFREIFMWLLHGRRRGEVLSLQWEDIDFENRTYTIKDISNKAGVNMTYTLSDRLMETLEVLAQFKRPEEMKGYLFKGLSDKREKLNDGTLRNHWVRLREENNFPFSRMHDIRKLLSEYLMNQMLQGENIIDTVLGHIPNGIASRYATIKNTTVGPIVDKALDGLLEEGRIEAFSSERLQELQRIFPEKSTDQLLEFMRS